MVNQKKVIVRYYKGQFVAPVEIHGKLDIAHSPSQIALISFLKSNGYEVYAVKRRQVKEVF